MVYSVGFTCHPNLLVVVMTSPSLISVIKFSKSDAPFLVAG